MWTFLGLSPEATQAGEGRSKVYFGLFYGIMLTCCPICVSQPPLSSSHSLPCQCWTPHGASRDHFVGCLCHFAQGFHFLAIIVWETNSTSHAVRRFRPLWIQLQVSCLTKKRNLHLPSAPSPAGGCAKFSEGEGATLQSSLLQLKVSFAHEEITSTGLSRS